MIDSAHIPEPVLNRYRKVLGLAERGEGGEQQNAQSIVDSLEEKYPGIRRVALAGERRGTFVVPEGEPAPTFWQAAWDAVGLASGRADPEELFAKYSRVVESAQNPLPRGVELAELTQDEAEELVRSVFHATGTTTALGGMRFRIDTPAQTVGLLRGYARSLHNRRLIAGAFGRFMAEWLFAAMGD